MKNNNINKIIQFIYDYNDKHYYRDNLIVTREDLVEEFGFKRSFGNVNLDRYLNILIHLKFVGELDGHKYQLAKDHTYNKWDVCYVVSSEGLKEFFDIDTKKEWHE